MILIGTSGYSFPDWVGPFYPAGIDRSRMLDYYARQFTAVEVNATYYRIPPPSTMFAMERKTPPGFEFVVKANQEMTHSQSLDPELYRSFHRALDPLRMAGKLSGVIAQFPYAFRSSVPGEALLRSMKRMFGEIPFFVEFRHASWIREETFRFLESQGIGYVSVDEPNLPGLVPPIARATESIAYVRLHGRNKENWWGAGHGGGDRYDYLYSEEELKEWAQKIRDLSAQTPKTFVFFNNCHVGQAATNARLMRRLLDLPEPALADLPGLL